MKISQNNQIESPAKLRSLNSFYKKSSNTKKKTGFFQISPCKKSLFLHGDFKKSLVISPWVEEIQLIFRYIYSPLYSSSITPLYDTYSLSLRVDKGQQLNIKTRKYTPFAMPFFKMCKNREVLRC